MKKGTAVFMAILLLFSAAACASTTGSSENKPEPGLQETADAGKETAGVGAPSDSQD